ncbi:hypothetical protein CYLTODRAFT_444694 [Cylindrobasidium torrendii FP15055 ss-10]|uniref:Uncharacterized protein n=1 Tax=Cylindrobasidium torrendii FP15055 ss-10 TaxID=1314674 RepID=A0A0D7BA84_9AGAR|nr:hypothetical protein CYLTODRAFT_444694 [Cylindrobasidium torrendii FP15055 ss-10]
MSSSQQELFPIHVEDIAVLWVPRTSSEAESWQTSAMLLSQSIKRSWKEIVEGVLTPGYDEDHGNMHTALIHFLDMLEDFQKRSIQLWIDDSFHDAAYKVAARSSDVNLLRRIQQIPKLSQIPQFDGRTITSSPPLGQVSPQSSPSAASSSSRVRLDEWQPSDGSDPVSVQRQTLGSGWIHYDQQVRFRPWEP